MTKTSPPHLITFHLFNDYSGSPRVLTGILKGLAAKGARIDLVTSGRGGALDELERLDGVAIHRYRYAFSSNPAVTMLKYLMVQVLTFCWALRWATDREATFYVNTLLPVGPALAGRLTGKRVVYHYHENAFAKGTVYRLLARAMQRLAHEIVCVSAYQASFLPRKEHVTVVPNALQRDFVARLRPDVDAAFGRQTVMMLSSLKEYKGTRPFMELAGALPQFRFVLVINDTQEHIDRYLTEQGLSPSDNLTIHPRQTDVARFYNEASVVVNLSDKRRFVETFGMTALEAMTNALPLIVPTVGGIADMVEEDVTGYHIDVTETERIRLCLTRMLTDRALYGRLAQNARAKAKDFEADALVNKMYQLIQQQDLNEQQQ
jgi:glycosyltransferase involved in cell wall biosynthesis